MVGKTLGHYRIEEQIGAGGMGVVYRARDVRLDRDVALKILPRDLLGAQNSGEQLRKEALALSRLNHPNIAHVYDFDVEEGVAFLIMEFVKGETLARRIADGLISEEAAVHMGVQVASALEDAAEVGIVHRDIKPSNIMLTAKGAVKVLDFGLAKLSRAGDHDLTRSHEEIPDAAGTLPYMAPERLRNEPADSRSDIYSLGSVLYESATGRRPFLAADSVTLIAEILNKKPAPPREINSTLSGGFESMVLRCLAKEPARRYQRASELRAALESIQESRRDLPLAPHSLNFKARRMLSAGLLAMGVAAMCFLIWRAPKRTATAEASAPSELAVLPLADASTNPEDAAFGNGLVETLTTRLTQLSQNHPLQVVPASEMRAKNVTNLQEASKEFGATLGLELSVERSGESIRVNYSLVDARHHKTLRADMVTEPASDPFGIEDKVGDSVVAALQIELTPEEKNSLAQHGTAKPGAYDYYLQGRGYLLNFHEPKNVEAAIAEFNHALEEDPNYSLAYAGLGEAYWYKFRSTSNPDWVRNAKSACARAVSLRSDEAAGHDCLGLTLLGTGAYQDAVKEYQRASELQPADDAAFRGLAVAYERLNQPQKAEETFRKAIALRPGYWAGYSWLGELYLDESKYSDAEPNFSEVIALAPDSYVGYGNLGITYLSEGHYTKALPLLERSVSIEPTADNTSNLATCYFNLRRYADSVRLNEEALAIDKSYFVIWGNLGDAYFWAAGGRAKAKSAYRTAITLAQAQLNVNPNDANTLAYLAGYHAMLGESGPAVQNIQEALAIAPNHSDLLLTAAIVYDQLGREEESLAYLEKAVAAGTTPGTLLDTPNFDNLRSQPRFQKLVSKAPLN
jgi:serine/threonine protein kinase/Tfp pilus assembly protein PilF